jgi:predicted nucleic acid-binding protein
VESCEFNSRNHPRISPGAVTHQFPFYDAQIWATAKLSGIPAVLSEDFSHASRIEGVLFLNPFVAALPGEEV